MNDLSLLFRTSLRVLTLALGLMGAPYATAQAIRTADYIVAVVNSEPITRHELENKRLRLQSQARAEGQAALAEERLTRAALDELINEHILLQLARESGIRVDEAQLDQAILSIAANNQISRDELLRRVQGQGNTVAQFRDQLRTQIAINQLREREVERRITVSDTEADLFLREELGGKITQSDPDIHLGMILVPVPENASTDQVQALFRQAQAIAQRARQGENFSDLAKAQGMQAAQGLAPGEMGLKPAYRYPELFLQTTQKLKPGEVSDPVRSGAGFHVLKVIERRQAEVLQVQQTHPRHILLRTSASLSEAQALSKLEDWRQKILRGQADFARVAREISQDGSAEEGGDLGWVYAGQFVPEFEQIMNRLAIGEISAPLISRFGVHLVQVLERREVPVSAEEQREMARNLLRNRKAQEAFDFWLREQRARAYVDVRELP